MPRTEPADVLAHSTVQHAIGDMIAEAARLTGVQDKHGQKMRLALVERIAEGYPIDSAVRLVEAIRNATIPPNAKSVRPLLLQCAGFLKLAAVGGGSAVEANALLDKIGQAIEAAGE